MVVGFTSFLESSYVSPVLISVGYRQVKPGSALGTRSSDGINEAEEGINSGADPENPGGYLLRRIPTRRRFLLPPTMIRPEIESQLPDLGNSSSRISTSRGEIEEDGGRVSPHTREVTLEKAFQDALPLSSVHINLEVRFLLNLRYKAITTSQLRRSVSMAVRSVKVGNLSSGATEHDIKEFFSFSGEVESIDIQSNEHSAYVTFKDPQGAETAVLLSGASIADQSVVIEMAPNYTPPAAPHAETQSGGVAESVVQKAEDVVSTMLAKGFILGKDAVGKAKAFDEKLGFTSTATAGVASIDQKIGLSQKFTAGTSLVTEKIKGVDQSFQVTERTKSAFATAEQTVSSAGTAVMKNRFVLTGVSWAAGAFNRVAKAAGEVGQKTKEKVEAEQPPQPSQSEQKPPEGYSPLH
uniref:RRM domain-containing protein n=3 Tax=Brassica TaxID=3705 RepID=A0A0D3AJE9_BRAOL